MAGFDRRHDRPRAGDWLMAEIKNALDRIIENHAPDLRDQGVPIEEYIPDEERGISDWFDAQTEENLIYSVEVIPVTEPVAPEGVVIHYRSGRSQKVEMVYIGIDEEDGLHTWEVTTHPQYRDVARVEVRTMPRGSKIHLGGPGGP